MGVATLYGIRNCDSVKKARAWLEEQGIQYRFHDYKIAGIDDARLNRWCEEVGWEALLNRAGTTFRKLTEREKEELNRSRALVLMKTQPSVIKRPVVETPGRLIVGFKPEVYRSVQW
jgi:arsenate reductase (glutaredoxin)